MNNMKKNVSRYFFKIRPWDPSKKLDLASCYKAHQSRALYDFSLTDLVKKEGCKLASENVPLHHEPLFTISIAFKDITNGKIGNAIYLLFIH